MKDYKTTIIQMLVTMVAQTLIITTTIWLVSPSLAMCYVAMLAVQTLLTVRMININ